MSDSDQEIMSASKMQAEVERDSMSDLEDMVEDVQNLISRHRVASPSSKKRERDFSPKSDLSSESPKSPRKDELTSQLTKEVVGHYIFRAARPAREDMLDFIRKSKTLSFNEDDHETNDLVSIIRRVETSEEDDLDTPLVSRFTRNLVRKDESSSDSSDDNLDVTFDKILHKEFKKESKFERSSVCEENEVTMVTEEYESVETNIVSTGSEEKKEIASVVKDEDLDFSFLESSSPLNINANKQKVVLRQKGSLANRRKPTRSTLRSSVLSDTEVFDNLSPTSQDPGEIRPQSYIDVVNGHVQDEVFNGQQGGATEEQAMVTSPLRPQPKLPSLKQPVLLPGITDGLLPKLKTTVKTSTVKTSTAESQVETELETPPWLAESRLRKKSLNIPTKPDTESEPEKPAWMKDALAKRKKVADILQSQQAEQTSCSNKESSDSDDPPLAPWMKERQLKKTNRPAPLKVTHREMISNVENTVETETSLFTRKSSSKQQILIETIKTKDLTSTRVKDTPSPKRSSIDAGLPTENIIDENTPPRMEKETFVTETETFSSYRTQLPPISSRAQSLSSSSQESIAESSIPSWKAEIQQRKKSKSHIPSQRLDQPMTLSQTPQWKKDLVEKNKTRPNLKDSSIDTMDDPSSLNTPAWKQELAHRKKKLTPRVLEPIDKTVEQPELDWKKQAEKRRQRLASKGFLASADEDIVG